jgi:hypothetical protein
VLRMRRMNVAFGVVLLRVVLITACMDYLLLVLCLHIMCRICDVVVVSMWVFFFFFFFFFLVIRVAYLCLCLLMHYQCSMYHCFMTAVEVKCAI